MFMRTTPLLRTNDRPNADAKVYNPRYDIRVQSLRTIPKRNHLPLLAARRHDDTDLLAL